MASGGPDSSGERLAKSQAKRLCATLPPTSSEDPEWIYHFHLLQHSLNPSLASFENLLQLATNRKDVVLVQAIRLMRIQWTFTEKKLSQVQSDLDELTLAIKANPEALSTQFKMYYLTFKLVLGGCMAISTPEAMKADRKELHLLLDVSAKLGPEESAGLIKVDLLFYYSSFG